MSPSWQSQTSAADHRSTSGPGSVTSPTPSSTPGLAGGQRVSGGEEGAESTSHTPGMESEGRKSGDGDAQMADMEAGPARAEGMIDDVEHRRSDHERGERESADAVQDLPPAPRLYKLHTEPIPPSQPHPTQNLIDLYSLHRLQASVARRDAQGNKINKLRKSYEGKVKALGLEGQSKAVPGNGALEGLLDAGWDEIVADGQSLWEQQKYSNYDPLTEQSIEGLIGRVGDALSGMSKGRFPSKDERKHWEDVLGLSQPKPASSMTAQAGVTNPLLAKTAPGQAVRASAPASPRAGLARPERTGKKRRYDDSSFSGYADTFVDDDGGYSTGGDSGNRHGSTTKRQKTASADLGRPVGKKDFPPASSPSFNHVMVGVKSS